VLQNLAVLADGTLSSSTTVGVGEELFLATFDFKGAVAQQLVERLREVFPQFVIRTPEGQPTFMDLPAPFEVNLDATIGYFQRTAADRFVPFVVTKVFS
jgi:hypothetical protein